MHSMSTNGLDTSSATMPTSSSSQQIEILLHFLPRLPQLFLDARFELVVEYMRSMFDFPCGSFMRLERRMHHSRERFVKLGMQTQEGQWRAGGGG